MGITEEAQKRKIKKKAEQVLHQTRKEIEKEKGVKLKPSEYDNEEVKKEMDKVFKVKMNESMDKWSTIKSEENSFEEGNDSED